MVIISRSVNRTMLGYLRTSLALEGLHRKLGDGSCHGSTGKFGIYVSTDSPYLKKLTSELTNLKDIVVGCIRTCEFHHADHNANEHLDPDPEFNDDVFEARMTTRLQQRRRFFSH